MEPIKEYKFMGGYIVTLYPNRLEIAEGMPGMMKLAKHKTIPIRTITEVHMPVGKRLEIKTITGEKHTINLSPDDAKDLKARLADLV